ncbi:MAG: 3-alpha domain-containing protein [Terracidiphilus sp.]|jgi:hypothetical protein
MHLLLEGDTGYTFIQWFYVGAFGLIKKYGRNSREIFGAKNEQAWSEIPPPGSPVLGLQRLKSAALLVSHRRPGFYCRVIMEGEVGAGDEIRKIADGPERISVAEIDSLLYSANHDLNRIAIAARIPALSPGWKGSFNGFLQADKNGIHNGNPGLTPSCRRNAGRRQIGDQRAAGRIHFAAGRETSCSVERRNWRHPGSFEASRSRIW